MLISYGSLIYLYTEVPMHFYILCENLWMFCGDVPCYADDYATDELRMFCTEAEGVYCVQDARRSGPRVCMSVDQCDHINYSTGDGVCELITDREGASPKLCKHLARCADHFK